MNIKSIAITIALIASTIFNIWSRDKTEELFSFENETFSGMNLNYRMAEGGDSTKIVVLYLHGGSGQGNDNRSQMKNPAIMDIYTYLTDNHYSFVFLVPQAPYGQQWMGSALPALKGLLDKYSNNGAEKIYILGSSMGGLGTWNMLSSYPGYFAGAMPVAFDTPKNKVEKYVGTKIYSVVGRDDKRRNIGKCKSFIERLNKHKGKAKLDIENSWGHRQTCEWSFTPQRLHWIFEE